MDIISIAITYVLGLLGIKGWATFFVLGIVTWLLVNRERIHSIVLRIEKEKSDGWDAMEKQNLAVDVFFNDVYPYMLLTPKLAFLLKIIPKPVWEKAVRWSVMQFCEKSRDHKETVMNDGKPKEASAGIPTEPGK